MGDLKEKYNSLPEWLRWILFLPVSFIVVAVLTLFFVLIDHFTINLLLISTDNTEIPRRLFAPILVQIPFLYLIYYTIPRWKIGAMIFFVSLRTLIAIGAIIMFVYFITQQGWAFTPAETLFKILLDIIGETLVFILSIVLIATAKKGEWE